MPVIQDPDTAHPIYAALRNYPARPVQVGSGQNVNGVSLPCILTGWAVRETGGANPTSAVSAYGTSTAPLANGVIASLPAQPAGLYSVQVMGWYGATPDVADNMKLVIAGVSTLISALPVNPVANAVPIPVNEQWRSDGTNGLQIQAIAAGGVGAVFKGLIVASPQQASPAASWSLFDGPGAGAQLVLRGDLGPNQSDHEMAGEDGLFLPRGCFFTADSGQVQGALWLKYPGA